jgi:hypothetical protein
LELHIKTADSPVKYAEIACESVSFGFDGRGPPDYVTSS